MNYNNQRNDSRGVVRNPHLLSPFNDNNLYDLSSARSIVDSNVTELKMQRKDSCLIDALKTSLISEEKNTQGNENGIKSPGLLFLKDGLVGQ